jgi:hypothetical protein
VTQAGGKSQADKRLGLTAAMLKISRNWEDVYEGLFRKLNNVCTRRRGCCPALPNGSPVVPQTLVGNVSMDAGVVTLLPTYDTGGPTVLRGDARRVRAYLRRRIYGQSGSQTTKGHSLAANYVALLHLAGGGVPLSGKEVGRDGRSDTIWRRRPSGSPAAGKPRTEGFE